MISSRFLLFAAALLLNQGVAGVQTTPFVIQVRFSYKSISPILIPIQPDIDYTKCLQSKHGRTNGSAVVLADCTGNIDQQVRYNTNGIVTMYGGAMCLVGTPTGNGIISNNSCRPSLAE
jgi:hypothetical protein